MKSLLNFILLAGFISCGWFSRLDAALPRPQMYKVEGAEIYVVIQFGEDGCSDMQVFFGTPGKMVQVNKDLITSAERKGYGFTISFADGMKLEFGTGGGLSPTWTLKGTNREKLLFMGFNVREIPANLGLDKSAEFSIATDASVLTPFLMPVPVKEIPQTSDVMQALEALNNWGADGIEAALRNGQDIFVTRKFLGEVIGQCRQALQGLYKE
jgi:hypothetical protein